MKNPPVPMPNIMKNPNNPPLQKHPIERITL